MELGFKFPFNECHTTAGTIEDNPFSCLVPLILSRDRDILQESKGKVT